MAMPDCLNWIAQLRSLRIDSLISSSAGGFFTSGMNKLGIGKMKLSLAKK